MKYVVNIACFLMGMSILGVILQHPQEIYQNKLKKLDYKITSLESNIAHKFIEQSKQSKSLGTDKKELESNLQILNDNNIELEKQNNILRTKFEEFTNQCYMRCGK